MKIKNLLLLLILLISQFSYAQQSINSIVKTITADKFKAHLDSDNGIILDVRTPEEVDQGCIKNASTINLYDPEFISKIRLISKEKAIYVYCQSGGRSAEASNILEQNGFRKIYNLEGGMMSWTSYHYPVELPKKAIDSKILQYSLTEFYSLIKNNKIVLIEFHTLWCAPCKKMAPIIDSLEIQFKNDVVVKRIDLDKSKEITKEFNIYGVPVFIIFVDGVEKWRHTGIIEKTELIKCIKNNKWNP